MKVTAEQLVERYAGMTDEELEALDPQKLTAEAAELRAAEMKTRGLTDTPAAAEARARTERRVEHTHGRQRKAVMLVVAALLVTLAGAELPVPRAVTVAAVVVLCVLAVAVLRRR